MYISPSVETKTDTTWKLQSLYVLHKENSKTKRTINPKAHLARKYQTNLASLSPLPLQILNYVTWPGHTDTYKVLHMHSKLFLTLNININPSPSAKQSPST